MELPWQRMQYRVNAAKVAHKTCPALVKTSLGKKSSVILNKNWKLGITEDPIQVCAYDAPSGICLGWARQGVGVGVWGGLFLDSKYNPCNFQAGNQRVHHIYELQTAKHQFSETQDLHPSWGVVLIMLFIKKRKKQAIRCITWNRWEHKQLVLSAGSGAAFNRPDCYSKHTCRGACSFSFVYP